MLRVRYGTCSWDEQRVTARERRRRAVAGGERRENSRTQTPPKDLTTLTFFFTAAYTRSALEVERARRIRGQERRDGLGRSSTKRVARAEKASRSSSPPRCRIRARAAV